MSDFPRRIKREVVARRKLTWVAEFGANHRRSVIAVNHPDANDGRPAVEWTAVTYSRWVHR